MTIIDKKLKELEEAYRVYRSKEYCEKDEVVNQYKAERDSMLSVAFVGGFTDEKCIYEYDKSIDISIDKDGRLTEVVTVEGEYIKAISEHETTYDVLIQDLKEADETEWVFGVDTEITFDMLTRLTLLAREVGEETEDFKQLMSQINYEVILEDSLNELRKQNNARDIL